MSSFVEKYFGDIPAYPAPALPPAGILLHQNEMPNNVPLELRQLILERFNGVQLNRYPHPLASTLVADLASWYGCRTGQIMVGPGSSSFIRLLLTYFGMHVRGKLIITRPSFVYYEQYCQAFKIPYDTWNLNENFQYNTEALNDLPEYSVVFLASPNNPTGNSIPPSDMRRLLEAHPRSLFVVDEAYAEFTKQSMLPLLAQYDNLTLLRTFSKTFSAAGLRCGSVIGGEAIIAALTALQTPWQMSVFNIEASRAILEYARSSGWLAQQISSLIDERRRVFQACKQVGCRSLAVYPSQANFLLIKASTSQAHQLLMLALRSHNVVVADFSRVPSLENCIRDTIGTMSENDQFLDAYKQAAACL